jgi:hypothetical protein
MLHALPWRLHSCSLQQAGYPAGAGTALRGVPARQVQTICPLRPAAALKSLLKAGHQHSPPLTGSVTTDSHKQPKLPRLRNMRHRFGSHNRVSESSMKRLASPAGLRFTRSAAMLFVGILALASLYFTITLIASGNVGSGRHRQDQPARVHARIESKGAGSHPDYLICRQGNRDRPCRPDTEGGRQPVAA